jgi:hypothetical protein
MAKRRDGAQIEALMPWYVNGSLGEAETDKVNAALEGSDAMKKLLEVEVALARRLQQDPPRFAEVMRCKSRTFSDLLGSADRPALPAPEPPAHLWRNRLLAAAALAAALTFAASVWVDGGAPDNGPFGIVAEPAADHAAGRLPAR